MWFIQPKQDYVAQMPWKHIEEPALMAWQIRARNYDTFIANIIFLAIFLFATGWGYFFSLWGDDSPLLSLVMGGGCFYLQYLLA